MRFEELYVLSEYHEDPKEDCGALGSNLLCPLKMSLVGSRVCCLSLGKSGRLRSSRDGPGRGRRHSF